MTQKFKAKWKITENSKQLEAGTGCDDDGDDRVCVRDRARLPCKTTNEWEKEVYLHNHMRHAMPEHAMYDVRCAMCLHRHRRRGKRAPSR